MKIAKLISILSIFGLFIAYGASYDDYGTEYYDEAYYQDFTEEEMARLAENGDMSYAQGLSRNSSQKKYATHVSNNYTNNEVEMRPLIDPKTGQASAYAPIPKSWKLGKIWEAPGGTKVEMRQGGSASAQQRPIRSIDQLLQRYLIPDIRKAGIQVDNILDLPGIARTNEINYAKYWQAMPTRVTHQVKGIEVTNSQNGEKGLFIVNLIITQSQFGSFNTHYSSVLTAKAGRYENDKKALIYALENMRLDPQAVARHNQREQQKSQASWANHNQRMRNNKANFNAWQKTQNTLSEISDISHEGYMNRSRMNDAGHQKSINGIWEQETSVNPYNGQQMNTSIHYKYNYVNQNGQVFGTNNPNYNPALDPKVNYMQWQKVNKAGNY